MTPKAGVRTLRGLALAGALGIATGFALGIGLGWVSWSLWIIGMHALVVGLAVGVAVGFALALTGGPWGRAARVVAALGIVTAWCGEQAIEDRHFLTAHRQAIAIARQASTNLKAELREKAFGGAAEDDARVLASRDADAQLDREVEEAVGFGGLAGRWLYRADEGVRLGGSWRQSRGVPVGRVGVIVWALAENALALYLAHRVLLRIERRVRQGLAPATPPDTRPGHDSTRPGL